MADVRDNGMAALERGDNRAAVTLLSAACHLDPDDFASHLGLGQALQRLGHSGAAVAALERAVTLAPPSADARRELGLALAAEGRTPEAMHALQAALTLRPNDRAAQEALTRLREQALPSQQAAPPVYSVIKRQFTGDLSAPHNVAYPSHPQETYTRMSEQCTPLSAQHEAPTQSLPTELNATSKSGPLTGQEPTLAVMPPPIGDRLSGQAVPNYGFPATAPIPGRGQYLAGPAEPEVRGYDDDCSATDAYYDLLEILASPRDFFEAQAGWEGTRAPLSMLAVYTINLMLSLLVVLFTAGAQLGPVGMLLLVLLPFGLALLYAALTTVAIGATAILHACTAIFRGRGSFSGSFRAVVYSGAPIVTAVALALALSSVRPHSPMSALLLTALPYALGGIALLWSAVLLGLALRYIHHFALTIIVLIFCLLAAIGVGCGFALNLLPGLIY